MLAPSAFLASAAGTSKISRKILPSNLKDIKCPSTAEALQIWSQGHHENPPPNAESSLQKAWDAPKIKSLANTLLSEADPKSKGRLLAANSKESGAWLNAPPMSALGLRMDDETVRIAVGLRLGSPLCTPHKCFQCGGVVDDSGTHGLSCRKSLGRLPRHAALNELVKRSLTAIDIPSTLEPSGLCRSDGKRSDGLTIIPWKNGRSLVWDVTCHDTFAPSNLALAATARGQPCGQPSRIQEKAKI